MVMLITTPVFVIMASIVVIVIDVIAVNLQMHRRQNHHDAHIQKSYHTCNQTTSKSRSQISIDNQNQDTTKMATIKNNDTAIVSAIITTMPIKFITNNMSL